MWVPIAGILDVFEHFYDTLHVAKNAMGAASNVSLISDASLVSCNASVV